jgi:hypothetical protein
MILAMLIAAGAADLSAQRIQGPRARADVVGRDARTGGAPAVEGILRMRDRLELTDGQVAQLEALRSERVAQRTADEAVLSELRSQLRAGTIERAEAADRMRALREDRAGQIGQDREQVEALLNETQQATLREVQMQRRAFEAGRRSAMRDRTGNGRQGSIGRGAPGGRQGPGARLPRRAPRDDLGPRGRRPDPDTGSELTPGS